MRSYHRALVGFLADQGCARVRVVHSGEKHPRLVFTYGDREHSIPIAGSPSNRRFLKQTKSQLRRILYKAA